MFRTQKIRRSASRSNRKIERFGFLQQQIIKKILLKAAKKQLKNLFCQKHFRYLQSKGQGKLTQISRFLCEVLVSQLPLIFTN